MPNFRTWTDLAYGSAGSLTLALDLHLPDPRPTGPLPVIVHVHGGAWLRGDKAMSPEVIAPFAEAGYAIASIRYRLSHEAIFPAQIHDCKAAVRWARAHAEEYGLDADHIGAWGGSAGGHLVALLGTSGGVAELEGEGGHPGYSSRVQAVCDWFGPSDFRRMNDLPGAQDHDAPNSPESRLIGAPIQERPDLVARANPITYITGAEPPFLIMHGTQDRTVLPNQSQMLYDALRRAGAKATLVWLEGAGHGGPQFHTPQTTAQMIAFFDKHPKSQEG